MTDSARMKLLLRRTATATELLVTATVSTAIKLPPSQLHVERQAPLSPVFFLVMKGSQLYTAKEAVRKFLKMYQEPSSPLYSSSTSRAIFAGSELEVVKYIPAASSHVSDRPLPPPLPMESTPSRHEDEATTSFTFRGPPPRAESMRRAVSLAQWNSPPVSIRPLRQPSLTVLNLHSMNLPYKRRPSLTTVLSDKVFLKPPPANIIPPESPGPGSPRRLPSATQRQPVAESVRPAPTAVRRSSSSIRMKSPVRATEEEDEDEDVFPKAALRDKVPSMKQSSRGTFATLSQATKKQQASSSRYSLASRQSSKQQSSIWDEGTAEEEMNPTEDEMEDDGESSTGWSWLWGGDDSEDDKKKKKKTRR